MNQSKTILSGIMVCLIFVGASILSGIERAVSSSGEPLTAAASGNIGFAVLQPSPTPTRVPPVRILYLPEVIKQTVKLLAAWTADSNGNASPVFLIGGPIHYVARIGNYASGPVTVLVRWTQTGPCGGAVPVNQQVSLKPGVWEVAFPATLPDCAGIYTGTVEVTFGSETSSLSVQFVANPASTVFVSENQGFDKCNPPSIADMRTWWDDSPYWVVNIYLGGISLGCTNERLEPFWLHSVAQQGWAFIPTWVGPQAPCSRFSHRMSSNAAVAYQEGRAEANAAVLAANQVGLLGDKVIYYDVESYSGADSACRNTVASFLRGWVERLHEHGVKAGAYGAPCTSYITDWAASDPPPDDVWIAHWYTNNYDPDATVWDDPVNIPCISDDFWPNHRRIKQYTGDHIETWGGFSLKMDSDVLDGEVTALLGIPAAQGNPAGVSNPLTPELVKPVSPPLRAMQLLSPGQGWVLRGDQLLWTRDGGVQWEDVTPTTQTPAPILGVTFLDPRQGWLLRRATKADQPGGLTVLRTEDSGAHWQDFPFQLPALDGSPPIAAASLNFVDPQTGWIAFKLQTGSSFSLGRLFATQDGGRTWEERSLPLGEPVKFLDAGRGWVAGGPSGDLLYRTDDGGRTWRSQSLPISSIRSDQQAFFNLPTFVNEATGMLPVTLAGAPDPGLAVFITQDGGATWSLATHLDLDPAHEPGGPLPFSMAAGGSWWAASPGINQLYTATGPNSAALPIETGQLPARVVALDFTTDQDGWALVQEDICRGNKTPAGQAASAGLDDFSCESNSRLFQTSDGGQRWVESTMP